MNPARLVLGAVVGTIAVAAVSGLHYYLARRLALDLALDPALETQIVMTITVLGLTILMLPIGEHLVPPPVSRLLTVPPSLWMGLAFVLVSVLAASDLVGLALDLLGSESGPDSLQWRRQRALAATGLGLGLTAWGTWQGLRMPPIKRVEIPLERWPRALDGYRIAQISDIHIGPIRGHRFAAALTKKVNAIGADLICVTGDLVDGRVQNIGGEVEPMSALTAPDGVWFVTGNHDMYSGTRGWLQRVAELGFTTLANEHVIVRPESGGGFVIAGVHDHNGRFLDPAFREDVATALEGAPPDRPIVLLAHDPSTFTVASKAEVDLQISGHTHGGQIQPFAALVRLVIPYLAGLYERDGSTLYVSRGTGFWGPPLRLGAPAEITELVLRAPASSASDPTDR